MKQSSFLKCICGVLLLLATAIPAANAQQPMTAQPGRQRQPAAQAQNFPKLPPSFSCTAGILPGVWKLLHIYQLPVGEEETEFLVNPVQYLLFNTNNTYGKYNAGRNELAPETTRNEITKHVTGLQQYLLDSSGFIFFYQDKTPIDTQACFIVASSQGPFAPGQMLLMPPQGQIQGRLIRVYSRINEQPQQQRNNPVQLPVGRR